MIDLDAIEKRCEKATEGRWGAFIWDYNEGTMFVTTVDESGTINDFDGLWTVAESISPADADFIAHARQDLPDLLTLAREQQKRLEELETTIATLDALFPAAASEIDEEDGWVYVKDWEKFADAFQSVDEGKCLRALRADHIVRELAECDIYEREQNGERWVIADVPGELVLRAKEAMK